MIRRSRALLFALLTVPSTVALAVAAHEPVLTLALERNGISISGLPPGGRVALMSLSRTAVDSIVRVERRDELLTDDDSDGVVRLELDGGPALRSVWVVVDLATGGWAVGYPEGFPGRELAIGGRGRPEPAPAATRFDQPGEQFEVLLVRPGAETAAGVWGGALGDGGARDRDGLVDGSVRVTPAELGLLGERSAPEAFGGGDVLVLVEPRGLAHAVIDVPRPAAAGEEVTP